MARVRTAAHFAGRLLLVYAALLIPWPGANGAYDRYFQRLVGAVFASPTSRREITFEKVEAPSWARAAKPGS